MMLQMRKPVNTRIGRRFDNEEERIHIYVYSKKWKRKETYRWRMENQGVEGVLVGGEEGTKKTITHNGYENRERREKKREMGKATVTEQETNSCCASLNTRSLAAETSAFWRFYYVLVFVCLLVSLFIFSVYEWDYVILILKIGGVLGI